MEIIVWLFMLEENVEIYGFIFDKNREWFFLLCYWHKKN
jgi:Holliday junction resolvasome RuvABC DNA-binding subunit